MTKTIFPVDQVDTNADDVPDYPVYAGRASRQVLGAVLSGHTAGRPLGARSGVTPGTSKTSVTATAAHWTVQPMAGVLDVMVAVEAAAYWFAWDQAIVGNVNAADADDPRIDLLSIQVEDPVEDESELPSVFVVYSQGVADPDPVAPATPDQAMPLAWIRVPKATTGAPTVSWVAPFMAAAGGVTSCANAADYPANPYVGQLVDDVSLGRLLRFNAAGIWVPYIEGGFFRINRTTPLGGVDADGSRPVTWDGTPYSVGSAVSWPGGSGPLVATKAGEYEAKATSTFPVGTDFVGQYFEVNGVPFTSGRTALRQDSAHQIAINSVGDLTLSNGDAVQLVLFDADGAITAQPVTMSLKLEG